MANYKIPFFNGEMLSYVDYWHEDKDNFEWKDNYTFTSDMIIENYSRGRSSVTIQIISDNGRKYDMFISDFMDIIKNKDIINSRFSGEFTFCKKGKNYGLKMVK